MSDSGTPPRRRGRPRGRFDYKKGLLYDLIKATQPCSLTNRELAERLFVSDRQIRNYLRSMRETGLLVSDSESYRIDGDSWSNVRKITVQPKEK